LATILTEFLQRQGHNIAHWVAVHWKEATANSHALNLVAKASPLSDDELKDLVNSIELDWTDLAERVTPLLVSEGQQGATVFLERAGFSNVSDNELWTQVLEDVRTEMRERGAQLVGKQIRNGQIVDNPNPAWSITETTRDSLRTLLSQAVDEGWAANKTQTAIMDSESFSPDRALSIARTEAAFARAHGTHVGAVSAGMKTKAWIVSEEHTCEVCIGNEDQGKIPIDSTFSSGDDCPPAHPNCRCAAGYYDEEESSGEEE
jgi:Phage Mu protein F like protein